MVRIVPYNNTSLIWTLSSKFLCSPIRVGKDMGGQEIKTALGRNIKLFRAHRQFSQEFLAEKAEISVAYLSKIERGMKYPKPDIISQIAEGLCVEVHELFKMNFDLKFVPAVATDDRKKLINRLSKIMTTKVNDAVNKALNNSMKKVFMDFEK